MRTSKDGKLIIPRQPPYTCNTEEDTGKVICHASPNKIIRNSKPPSYGSVQTVHPINPDQGASAHDLLDLEREWRARLRAETHEAFEQGREAGRKQVEEELNRKAEQQQAARKAQLESMWAKKLACERRDYFEHGKRAAKKEIQWEHHTSATVSAAMAVSKAAADFDGASTAVEQANRSVEEARMHLKTHITEGKEEESPGKEAKKVKKAITAKLEHVLRHAELVQASKIALLGQARKVVGECNQRMVDLALSMGAQAEVLQGRQRACMDQSQVETTFDSVIIELNLAEDQDAEMRDAQQKEEAEEFL